MLRPRMQLPSPAGDFSSEGASSVDIQGHIVRIIGEHAIVNPLTS
jgi:hypothetical protein